MCMFCPNRGSLCGPINTSDLSLDVNVGLTFEAPAAPSAKYELGTFRWRDDTGGSSKPVSVWRTVGRRGAGSYDKRTTIVYNVASTAVSRIASCHAPGWSDGTGPDGHNVPPHPTCPALDESAIGTLALKQIKNSLID